MRCRAPYCANNPRSTMHFGELCEDCEARARRRDELEAELEADDPRCSVCECRKSEHGDVWPCKWDDQDEEC